MVIFGDSEAFEFFKEVVDIYDGIYKEQHEEFFSSFIDRTRAEIHNSTVYLDYEPLYTEGDYDSYTWFITSDNDENPYLHLFKINEPNIVEAYTIFRIHKIEQVEDSAVIMSDGNLFERTRGYNIFVSRNDNEVRFIRPNTETTPYPLFRDSYINSSKTDLKVEYKKVNAPILMMNEAEEDNTIAGINIIIVESSEEKK